MESLIGQKLMKIDELYNHLDIIEKLNTNRVRVESHLEKLLEGTQNYLSVKKRSLDNTLITIEDLSPYNVMKRGYAIIINQEGKAVSRVKTIKEKDLLSLIFLDGQAKALVECVKEKYNE